MGKLTKDQIAGIITGIVIIITVVLLITLVIIKTQEPEPFVSSNSNGAVVEKYFDDSIPEATDIPQLIDLIESSSRKLWCKTTFYAYRYVNRKTGAYGTLSSWSTAVVANNSVNSQNPLFEKKGNLMTSPIMGLPFDIINFYTIYSLNVHRLVDVTDTTGKIGEVIGAFVPGTITFTSGGEQQVPITYRTIFIDTSNPYTSGGICSSVN